MQRIVNKATMPSAPNRATSFHDKFQIEAIFIGNYKLLDYNWIWL